MNVQPPNLFGNVAETELRERDPHLGCPTSVIDGHTCFPHRIELALDRVLVVGGMEVVEAHSGRRHPERVGGAPVEVGVERDQEIVGLLHVVAPAHGRLHCSAGAARHAGSYVQSLVVVQEAHLGRVRGRCSFHGLLLDQVGYSGSLQPVRLVQAPVHPDGACGDASRGGDLGGGRSPLRWRRSRFLALR